MSTAAPSPTTTASRRPALAGLLVFAVLAAALLLWSKWDPYARRTLELGGTHTWAGSSVLDAAGVRPGAAPSLGAGWAFTLAYSTAVWKAVLTGLVISAAVQTLVPRRWLLSVMARRTPTGSAVAGGLLSTPSMMCTCCTAPVANALRRSGVPTAGVVAYWLGNPLLNPAVLVFLLLVAPWQWAATRLLVGALVVVGGAVLVARLTTARLAPEAAAAVGAATPAVDAAAPGDEELRTAPSRFARTLARTALVVVPEYLLVVFAVGCLAGWLFPLGESARSFGALALLAALVLGTLLVIPTAGEIPLAQGLAAAGAGGAVVGALLIVLPALSLPSMVMVGRALTWRVTLLSAAVVVAGGALAAGVLVLLS
ncbi:permease [Kineococcus sp. NUM-3379]